MSRTSVRVGVAQMLGALQNDDDTPMFKAVYPVMPTRIDERLLPAAFVMIATHQRKRYAPNQKHANYGVQARVMWNAPSTGWQTPDGNVWETPANEPQSSFDAWLDSFARKLEQNKSFPQNDPESGVQTIYIGESSDGIQIATADPKLIDQEVVCSAIVKFAVAEQILGV